MSFNPATFGEGFHQFVQAEYQLFGMFSPILHVVSYLILIILFLYGNKVRLLFSVYFTINWFFLFLYWGIFGTIYWFKIGLVYLAMYIAAPILLTLITINWVKEVARPRINLNIRDSKKNRFLVLAILVWGLWYPSYVYGQGFSFELRDLFFSFYGLMPCPTTMVVLSLLTLKYPDTNRTLYRLLTMYALFIGTATVLSGWLPDIPFILLGIYSLVLMIVNKHKIRKQRRRLTAVDALRR